jgi:hypothetical protein
VSHTTTPLREVVPEAIAVGKESKMGTVVVPAEVAHCIIP